MPDKELVEVRQESPAELIKAALAKGADLTQLKGLLDLQEQYEANEARKAYHVAMTAFKADPPKIAKEKEVSFGGTSYKHATLSSVTEKINRSLSQHGLAATWKVQQNGTISVTCKITHVKGHSEETTMTAPADTSGSKNSIQAIGSTITYLERYTLLAATGLATDDMDDDAQGVTEVIDNKQLNQITDMILAAESSEAKLCAHLKIESLSVMPKAMFQKAMSALDAKIKAKK